MNPQSNKSYSFYININLNVGGLLGAVIITVAVHSEGKKHSCFVNVLSNPYGIFQLKGLFSGAAHMVRG